MGLAAQMKRSLWKLSAAHSPEFSDSLLQKSVTTADVTPFKATVGDHLFDMQDEVDGEDNGVDDFMVDEEVELRLKDVAEHTSLSNSTLSGGYETSDNYSHSKPQQAFIAREHDRFIPLRDPQANTTLNYEAKEFLFAQRQLNCTHSASEQCDCLMRQEQYVPQEQHQMQATDNAKKMY